MKERSLHNCSCQHPTLFTPPFANRALESPAPLLPQATQLVVPLPPHPGDGYALSQASFRELCCKPALSLELLRRHRFASTSIGHAYHEGTRQDPVTATQQVITRPES